MELRRRARSALHRATPRSYRDAVERVRELEEQHALLRSHVAKMEAEQAELALAVSHAVANFAPSLAEVQRLRAEDRAEVVSLLALLRASLQSPDSQPLDAATSDGLAGVDQAAFYEGFEARFRGTRESVREKMSVYIDDVMTLRDSKEPLLDIGPGRCEWLELLHANGIKAYGVDTNPRFVDIGKDLGLDVRAGDAIAHLHSLRARSLAAITAFQVIEHISTESLFDLVGQALRVLRPGGVLILETPNPLNLRVGSAQFWIDPSHVRPIHPQFLEYLCINRGFNEVQLRFNNSVGEPFVLDAADGASASELRRLASVLNNLLFEALDYAVVARAPQAQARARSKPAAAGTQARPG